MGVRGEVSMQTYTTSQVARCIGIHPNTVRLYEELQFITKPERKQNGYRVYTDLHVAQFRLARYALQIEVLQNGLRKKAISIIKLSAQCRFEEAIEETMDYIASVNQEIHNANEAIEIATRLLNGETSFNQSNLKRKEVSTMLGITMDTLRNWEMNGLLKVKRKENGYRVYTDAEVRRLKIIRSLKCANYSLSAILRAMNELDKDSVGNITELLNTPRKEDEIISACDKLLISLSKAKLNAQTMLQMLYIMKNKYF